MPSYLVSWLSDEYDEPFDSEDLPKSGKSHTGIEHETSNVGGDLYLRVSPQAQTIRFFARLTAVSASSNYKVSKAIGPITHGSRIFQGVFKTWPQRTKVLLEFSDTPFE